MRLGVVLAMAASAAFAEVSGVVVNQTTGKPQAGATVTLYKLDQNGMDSRNTVKSEADGKFSMPETPTGPHLVQTAFDGVTYNHMLPPGRPSTGLSLQVYNASVKPGDAKVGTHMILFESNGMELTVNESALWVNEGKTSFNDPANGSFQFYMPPGAGKPKVMCTAPQGMPIERAPRKTAAENVYAVDFPVKPGETRFDVIYTLPMTGPAEFTGKLMHEGGTKRLVSPQGLTLTTEDATLLGQEPQTQASIYELKKTAFKVKLEGTGSLRGPGGEAPSEDEGAGIKQIWPRLYDRFGAVLGLAALIMVLGLAMLSRRKAPEKR